MSRAATVSGLILLTEVITMQASHTITESIVDSVLQRHLQQAHNDLEEFITLYRELDVLERISVKTCLRDKILSHVQENTQDS